jgi:hypothetical protein
MPFWHTQVKGPGQHNREDNRDTNCPHVNEQLHKRNERASQIDKKAGHPGEANNETQDIVENVSGKYRYKSSGKSKYNYRGEACLG